jgi:hypothetical protein
VNRSKKSGKAMSVLATALGAMCLVTALPTSAQAASGSFSFQFTGSTVMYTVNNPASNTCYSDSTRTMSWESNQTGQRVHLYSDTGCRKEVGGIDPHQSAGLTAGSFLYY